MRSAPQESLEQSKKWCGVYTSFGLVFLTLLASTSLHGQIVSSVSAQTIQLANNPKLSSKKTNKEAFKRPKEKSGKVLQKHSNGRKELLRKVLVNHNSPNQNKFFAGAAGFKNADPIVAGPPKGWEAHILGVGAKKGPGDREADNKISDHKFIASPGTVKANLSEGSVEPSSALAHSHNRVLLPIPDQMGLAGYQSGNNFIIIIDGHEHLNVSALNGDGIFAKMGVTVLGGATVLTLPIPDTRKLYLSKQTYGWVLGDQPPPSGDYSDRREINPIVTSTGILFPMRKPGRVFSIKDPTSGRHIFVGTTIYDDGGLLSLRKTKDLDVWPTLEGVVIEDHDNSNVDMTEIAQGDLVTIFGGKKLSDLDTAVYASDVDLNWLNLKHLDAPQAEERYKKALIDAAEASPRERFAKRVQAAQAALGAGAAKDAQAILSVALDDDPEEAFREDIRFLVSATNLLAGDMKGAEPLGADWAEKDLRATRLWRGLFYAAHEEQEEQAAHLLARDIDRLLNYPDALRDVLLPLAAETIARFGDNADRAVLDKMPEGSPYKLAQAIRDVRNGYDDEATKLLEELSIDKDPVIAEKAMEEGITLSLYKNKIDGKKAAKQYTSILPDAILAGREGHLNVLRAQAYMKDSLWEKALKALDQASSQPKFQNDSNVKKFYEMAIKGLAEEIKYTPQSEDILHNVAILKAHLPEVSDSPAKADLLASYGQALDRIGLPDQAGEEFGKALALAVGERQRAYIGDLLADNQIQRSLYDAAGKTLNQTEYRPMPSDELARRNRLVAKMTAESGKPEVALLLLNADSDPEAFNLKSKIHEGKGEWEPALMDLKKVVSAYIGEQGNLTAQQQLLALRYASDASRAGNHGELTWIKSRIGDRVDAFDGEAGQMFQLLVSPE